MVSVKKGAAVAVKCTGGVLDFLERASGKLEPLKSAPLLGEYIADVQDIVAMLGDYYHGRYKKLPFAVLAGSLAIVAYLVSPIDLIPDGVPVLGFIDDALIINIVLELCVDTELRRYRRWRDGV